MHPARDELIQFTDQELTDRKRLEEIAAHLRNCDFCSEFCENYRQLIQPATPIPSAPPSENLIRLADRLYDAAVRSKLIDLTPMISDTAEPSISYLAADGEPGDKRKARSIATLYCENPEVILRIMQAPEKGNEYLQLLSEDDRFSKHVMVQVPELNREFITDADGRAGIDLETTKGLDKLKWQIKLPEAVFTLEPLTYDPEKVEYAEEISLETERHDVIKVRFEGKTEGKQLSIRVTELDGRTDFGPLKIAVTQNHRSELITAGPGVPVKVGLINANTTINIRIYQ